MKDLILYHWLHYLFQFGFLSKSTFFVPMHKFYALSDIWKRSKKKRKCSSEVQIPTNRSESLINILGILKCEWNWLKLRNKLASSLLLLPLSSYEIVKYWSFFAINNLKIDMEKKIHMTIWLDEFRLKNDAAVRTLNTSYQIIDRFQFNTKNGLTQMICLFVLQWTDQNDDVIDIKQHKNRIFAWYVKC